MEYYIRYSEINQTEIFLSNKKYFLKPYDSDVYGLAKIPPSMKGSLMPLILTLIKPEENLKLSTAVRQTLEFENVEMSQFTSYGTYSMSKLLLKTLMLALGI